MNLHVRPVKIATGSADSESHLVFADDFLVAVLVRLSDEHEADAGRWCLEAGFGPIDDPRPPTFADVDEAKAWIANRLAS